MKLIALSIIGALVLLWGAILMIFHLAKEENGLLKIPRAYFWSLAGYLTVVTAVVIYLVLQTSFVRQEAAIRNIQERFQLEMRAIRDRLGAQTDKLMSQINEKAELTGSEIEIRGRFREERNQHKRTREELAATLQQYRETRALLTYESNLHGAFVDSFNTQLALRKQREQQLVREQQAHQQTRATLEVALQTTQAELSKTQERLAVQDSQLKQLRVDIEKAGENLKKALENANLANNSLLQKSDAHNQSLTQVRSTVDSIYSKVLKRWRIPVSQSASQPDTAQ